MSAPRVIVVGAGFGGLAAAIRLQASGYQVVLLEQRDQPGGRAGQLEVDGYTFDTGPSIITAPQLLEDLWRAAGARLSDDVELLPLNPYYRIAFADGSVFDYGGTPEQVEAEIARFEPRDVIGYRRFMAASGRIYERAFADLAHQPFHRVATFARIAPELVRLNAIESVYSFVARYISDPRLRTAFSFHPLFIGGNPFRASAIYAIVPYLERLGGVWFARGGMFAVVRAMAALFERLGGELRLGAQVAEVLVHDGVARARGVRLVTDEQLLADAVVLNADVATAYLELVPARVRQHMTDRRIRGMRYSMSCFLLYLGLDRQYPQLRHHTLMLGPRYRELIAEVFDGRGLPADFSLYLHAPTRSDPSLAPAGGESLYVLAPVPHLGHGIDWQSEAEPFRNRIIHHLEHERGLSGLSAAIRVERRWTPVDFRDSLSSHLGAAFSIEPTLLQSAYFRPHNVSEDVRALYLVGAGTHPGAGVPGVLLSAQVTSQLVQQHLPVRRSASPSAMLVPS